MRNRATPQAHAAPHPAAQLHKPEVLAPAGGWPQLRAAVENGADSVYFGLSSFNARARAANFAPEELPEVLRLLQPCVSSKLHLSFCVPHVYGGCMSGSRVPDSGRPGDGVPARAGRQGLCGDERADL